ncbi:MAG: FAD-dependent oxidoreductase [Verrucomicrobiae bacterium]
MKLSYSLPVWKDVDVLVLGATTAAVTAALVAAGHGRRVGLIADEAYLGQDLAGTLHLWEEAPLDPLLAEAFASCLERPARPGALKRHLEMALIKAGIPFLFGTRPVGLLRQESGMLRGVVLAARTSLFVSTCREVVDASPFGLAARLEGVPLGTRSSPTDEIRWRVLASRSPKSWPGNFRPLPSPYRQVLKDGSKEYPAFELTVERGRLSLDPRSLEHAARAGVVDEGVWAAADELIDPGKDFLKACAAVNSVADLEGEQCHVAEGLWIANRLLPVTCLEDFSSPGKMADLGRRVGAMAAREVVDKPHSDEPLRFQAGGAAPGDFSFAEAFLRGNCLQVKVRAPEFPDWEDFDVVVAGGGTAGAPAAIAAARAGARTLCLEAAHGLGGVGTSGLISAYWFGNSCGFTSELDSLVSEFDSISREKGGAAWHPGVKSGVYHRLLQEAGGTAWLASFPFGVRKSGNRLDGVLVSTPFGCGFVQAKSFVDATGNADLAAAAGAACRVMDGRHLAVQGTGISPRSNPAVGRRNSDHTFIDDNDPEGITAAYVQARAKYPNDFETMPFINSRERRQIIGDLEVSPLDILAGRTFPDTVVTALSNFDTHGFIIHPVFMVVPPDHSPLLAHVPLRCMLPKGMDGLLVTGLGMSAHRDALPVIRMQPDVQNQGYAAGLLAAQVAQSGEGLRDVDIKTFQRRLAGLGIISASTVEDSDSFPMEPAAILQASSGNLDNAKDVAILFAHPESSLKELLSIMHKNPDAELRCRAALILGLMGSREAGPFLRDAVAKEVWDEGWNYRGMGQFGACMSRLDAMIIALGRTKDSEGGPALARLAKQLGGDAGFSHCRALALAAAMLRDRDLTSALEHLLDLPGFSGHAFLRVEDMLADSAGDSNATASRNLALRELYVARGLFLAGDPNGRGRRILDTYSRDLRGHFARHALAVLAAGPDDGSVLEMA